MQQGIDRKAVLFFTYGKTETDWLKGRDKRLASVIDSVGHIEREVHDDLFASVVHSIVGQQISTRAHATVWQRMQERFAPINAASLARADENDLQALGMTFRKAAYISDFAKKVHANAFDLQAIRNKPDDEAIKALASLKGIGVWTAEMILLFCLQRPNILSYADLGIQRGLRMIYRHRAIDKKLFERYRARFSPYGSVASLYLWAVAGGALPGLQDPVRAQKA